MGYYAEIKTTFSKPRDSVMSITGLLIMGLNAYLVWHLLRLHFNNDSPVVVIISGSMEPGLSRGDLLVVDNRDSIKIETGDVVILNIEGRGIPIVHRVTTVHESGFYPSNYKDTYDYHYKHSTTSKDDLRIIGRRFKAERDELPKQQVLTKGDANAIDDRGLYGYQKNFLPWQNFSGKIIMSIPYAGMPTILISDYPILKVALLAFMSITTLIGRESL